MVTPISLEGFEPTAEVENLIRTWHNETCLSSIIQDYINHPTRSIVEKLPNIDHVLYWMLRNRLQLFGILHIIHGRYSIDVEPIIANNPEENELIKALMRMLEEKVSEQEKVDRSIEKLSAELESLRNVKLNYAEGEPNYEDDSKAST